MHIGLIGGIGPAATIVYYDRLTRRVRGEGGRLGLTIVQADIDELIANVNADRREQQARAYLPLIQRLAAAGADCAAITSLGGHFCFPETTAISPLPLVSAVAPLDDHFVARGLRRVGLLGTEVVMRTRLYGQLTRTEAVAPDTDLAPLGRLYQAIAIAGACTGEQRATLVEAGRRMVEEQGAEAIVLAGTDLGLAFDGIDAGYPVIDALDVHVALLADLALGRASLEVATPASTSTAASERSLPTL
ncbi:MAG TPA: aspartate/glutamate racemase family protein, partial [Candidatus Limnocylindrales bacterium]